MALSRDQIDRFVSDGFVRIDDAFTASAAGALVGDLLAGTGCDPSDRSTWPERQTPLGDCTTARAVGVLTTPLLTGAYDQLVGPGRWKPVEAMTGVSMRGPDSVPAGPWHVDVGWQADGQPEDPYSWRVNVHARDFALLILVNLTDVGPGDGPTRMRRGSHVQVARRLWRYGEAGVRLRDLVEGGFPESAGAEVVLATGPAGTVHLCHPLLVHSGAAHMGSRLRVQANPGLEPVHPLRLDGDVAAAPPVEAAIMTGVALAQ